MKMHPLLRKAIAEFLGVAFFLTAILGSTSVLHGTPGTVSGLAVPALATVLGLAIFATASISGGHLNPAVSLYFYSRQKMSIQELFTYLAAQLLGAVFGTYVGLTLAGKSLGMGDINSSSSPAWLLGELIATGGLVWLVGRLASTGHGNHIPAVVALWVFAAATFTPSGAEANPAVAFGLMFAGHSVNETAIVIFVQLVGMLIASIFVTIFAEPKRAAVAASEAKPAVKRAPARKPAAKRAPAKKTATRKK